MDGRERAETRKNATVIEGVGGKQGVGGGEREMALLLPRGWREKLANNYNFR